MGLARIYIRNMMRQPLHSPVPFLDPLGRENQWNGDPVTDLLRKMNAYWRAGELSICRTNLFAPDNPLLREPLHTEERQARACSAIGEPRPALISSTSHMNRAIKEHDLNAIYIAGPGTRRAGPGRQYLLGRDVTAKSTRTSLPTKEGMKTPLQTVLLSRRHSPVHVAPETPAVDPRRRRTRLFPLPRLRRRLRQSRPFRLLRGRRRRGRRTGALATSWHSNKFLNPRDGPARFCPSCT